MRVVFVGGDPGTGKTSSYVPNEELGIKGLPPDETVVIACGGQGKELPMIGWQDAYKADLKIKDGGNFLQSYDFKLIGRAISYVVTDRPEIKYIVVDDAGFTMGKKVMTSEDKFEYDDWRQIAVEFYKYVLAPVIDRTIPNIDDRDITIIYMFHLDVDKKNKIVLKTSGQMLNNSTPLDALVSTLLIARVVDSGTGSRDHTFLTVPKWGLPARSLYKCFPSDEIPNDMGFVIECLEKYGKKREK